MSETAQNWYSAAEIAAMGLPGVPSSKQGIQSRIESENWLAPEREGQTWRRRQGRGGGFEFTVYALPLPARAALALKDAPVSAETYLGRRERADLWARFDALPERAKGKARAALEVIQAVEILVQNGTGKTRAVQQVSRTAGVGHTTINNWYRDLRGFNRCDWLAALAPRHGGHREEAACDPEIMALLKADYLRLERPRFTDCYRRARAEATKRGVVIPSEKTLHRRVQALPSELLVLAREGADALKRLFPAQRRDRSVFHALQAVNADGHRWDVFVKWPDGTIGRPVMVAFQDLFSGMMLSWRIDRSENAETVRLAFGDLVEEYGIPSICYLDNGRNFASKWLTGGTPNRFRFKVREDEPSGVMTQLGVDIRWTTPYSGQSKPIERMFRDFAGGIAKHPAFAGAWTGNNPMAKPENYASAAIPIAVFEEVLAAGIAEHNGRIGRRTAVCGGKLSFAQAFRASYEASPITKATAEQRRLWLMTAESLSVGRKDGVIELLGNRYWCEDLLQHRGSKVVVRFDPQELHADLHVYRTDGVFIASAPCVADVGFSDRTAAQDHGRARRQFMRAQKEMLQAQKSMTLKELQAAYVPDIEQEDVPEARIVRPFIPAQSIGNAALAIEEDVEAQMRREDEEEEHYRAVRSVIAYRPRVVDLD